MFHELIVISIFATTLGQTRYLTVDPNPPFVGGDFDGYIGLIRNAIDSASRTLSDARANINQKVDPTIRQLKTSLRTEIENLLQELHVLIGRKNISGIDINACVANSEQRIRELPVRFDKEILKCQEDLVNQEIAIVNEGKLEIDHLNQELNTLVDRYKGCSRILVVKCRNKVTEVAKEASVRIPVALSEVSDRVTAFDSNLQPNLENCGSGKIQLAVSEGRRIIDAVSACISSHVHPHNIN